MHPWTVGEAAKAVSPSVSHQVYLLTPSYPRRGRVSRGRMPGWSARYSCRGAGLTEGPPDPTMEKRRRSAMDEEKKEPLTLEYFMEQMYGVKVEKKAYTPEEMERYRTRLREYAQEKAAQRAEKQSKDGQRDT